MRKKWIVVGTVAAGVMALCAMTAFAAEPGQKAEAAPQASANAPAIEGVTYTESEIIVDGETGEIRDGEGNVLGTLDDPNAEVFTLDDEAGVVHVISSSDSVNITDDAGEVPLPDVGAYTAETAFTIDENTGEILDENGNVIGILSNDSEQTFTLADEDGNPIVVSVQAMDDTDGITMYSVTEAE